MQRTRCIAYVYRYSKDATKQTRMESRTIQAKLEITEEVMEEEEETQGLIVKVDPISQKLELTVDEVVEEYVGSFGFSQLLHVFLVSIPWIFDAQNTLVTIFTDAQPAAAWRSCTTTTTATSTCNVGDVVSTSSVCGLVAGSWEWVGGNKTSTIAEWGLICDRKFLAALPTSLFFIGSLLGSGFYGWIADALLGRKKTVVLSCILASITAFLTSLSPNIWIYALLRLANGFARSGIGICCLVLSTEAVGRKWRGQVGQYGFLVFTVGFLSLPLIAYPSRTCWRNVYKILSIFPLLYSVLILNPFVSESPRWLLLKGRSKEALDILQKYARLNGKKELPSNLSLAESASDGNAKLMNIFWSTKWAAKRMITLIIAGFGVGCIYYGVQLNVENLDFNLYITVTINAIMEIPAIFIGSILLSFINHRPHFSWSAYIAGVSSIICIVFSRGGRKKKGNDLKGGRGNWAQLSIEGVGLMAASRAFDMLYILCVELFPTNVRNFAVSMLRQSLILGASVAPLLVVLGRLSPSLSFLVFGILSICSGLLISLWLPETKNAPIYETLDQQQEGEKLNSLAMDQSALELEIK